MGDEPTIFSESLDRVLKGLRGPDRHQVGGLFGRWEEIVGDLVARHVRPVRLESRVLVVEVDEPAWATQFEFLSGQVVDRLRAEVGVEVDRVETRVARRGRRTSTGDGA
jgi:predicted nucleic acid-binding Zn ribbon protein